MRGLPNVVAKNRHKPPLQSYQNVSFLGKNGG